MDRAPTPRRSRSILASIAFALSLLLPAQRASALITGGAGNTPINHPGWPAGAAPAFDHPSRIAWWEGPPFGGGQWHSECRGDAKALNEVLAHLARLDAKTKRIVLHDGVGQSFWLNMNQEPEKRDAAKMDWVLMIWDPNSWEQLRQLPADLNPIGPADAANGPPAQIDVYTGGNVRWADVVVPDGLTVVDQRLEAHGFTLQDGTVIEGNAFDLATHESIPARITLQGVRPRATGGYDYPTLVETATDPDAPGRWNLKNVPAGWARIVVAADGYVPRVVGYVRPDGQPGWSSFEAGLARPGPVSGRVADESGQPLADVQVRLDNLAAADGARYELPDDPTFTTDAHGRFRADAVPAGKATVWLIKPGYVRPGLGPPIDLPAADVQLTMQKSASVQVTVDFGANPRPEGYIVQVEPEGGSKVGSWGGSGQIDANNQISFDDMPPGRYVLLGKPNPSGGDDQTEPVTVDLEGGERARVKLTARPL